MAMPVDSRASSQSIASSRLPVSGTASVSPNSANAPLTGTGQETSTASLARQSTTYDQLSGTSEWESAQGQQLQQNLSNLAHQDPAGFRHALAQAFGGKVDAATLDNLLDLALADELPMPASIQFVDAGALGESSLGAYDSADGGTLFLDRSLLSDPQQLQSVFNEEMGHHLDALLGGADAAGDEGAVFSRTLESGQLSQQELTALKSEDDHGVIQIGGRWVQVEFSQESAGNAEGESSGSSGDGGGGETGSSGGTDSGEETSSSGNTGSGESTGDTSGAGDGGHDSGQCSADGDYGSPTRDTPDKDTPSSFENGNSDLDKAGSGKGNNSNNDKTDTDDTSDVGDDGTNTSDDTETRTESEPDSTSDGDTESAAEPEPEKRGFWSRALDKVQTGLDVAGFVPGFGAVPDLINAGIHLARGNKAEAAISAAAAIPGAGDAFKAGTMGIKAANRLNDGRRVLDNAGELAKAGQQLDKNGLTKAGRALQKHGDREGSVFPKSSGSAADRNQQGQEILEEILSSDKQHSRPNRFGGEDIYDSNTGRGARFDGDGNMKGFLEP